MEKVHYNFRYSDNKRHYQFFKDALENSRALLRHLSYIIGLYEKAAKEFIVDNVIDIDAPFHKMHPKEILWMDPDELAKINFDHVVNRFAGEKKGPLKYMLDLYCQRDDLTARTEYQQANMDIWDERIRLYAPVFEKDSQEANEHFQKTWDKAKRLHEKYPKQLLIGLILKDYPVASQEDPETFDQDLKNQCYKALKGQIGFIETLDGEKSPMKKL